MKKISRRQLFGGTALALGSFAAGNAVAAFGQSPASPANQVWKYTPIDPRQAAQLTHAVYPDGHCMYAVTRAILTCVGHAWAQSDPAMSLRLLEFPFYMMKIGAGGFGGAGSLCGALAGGAQVIGLFVPDKAASNAMVQELFQFYETSLIPAYLPENDEYPAMPAVRAGATLCHLSVTAWCQAAGETAYSPMRAERCRRLSADMASETVKLLNRYHQDHKCAFAPLIVPTKSCVDCHGKGGAAEDTIVKMNCTSCHSNLSETSHQDRLLKPVKK